MMKKIVIVFVLFAYSGMLRAQENAVMLTGNLKTDNVILAKENQVESEAKRKNVFLATGLSALIPGAGQFYNGNYWLTAAFVTIEAAAIACAISYTNKGDDQTSSFEKYANEHWSAAKYAKWTIAHAAEISKNPSFDASQYVVFNADGNVNWNELNRLEIALGSWYSHWLPGYGEQQYYELIGKYQQFNMGWDDTGNEFTNFTYYDPVSKRSLYYDGERGKANDFYGVSDTFIKVLVVNHVLSAVEAAWSAAKFNKKLKMHASMTPVRTATGITFFPQINFSYNF